MSHTPTEHEPASAIQTAGRFVLDLVVAGIAVVMVLHHLLLEGLVLGVAILFDLWRTLRRPNARD